MLICYMCMIDISLDYCLLYYVFNSYFSAEPLILLGELLTVHYDANKELRRYYGSWLYALSTVFSAGFIAR